MPVLYQVELVRPKSGFGKPSVFAVKPFGLNFHLVDGEMVYPDMLAVAEVLPHHYRLAFHRAGEPWFDKNKPEAPAYLTLRDYTGAYLNTVVLTPYKI